MTSGSRGDIVLVKFVFADEKGVKQRPGLVISTDTYQQGRREVVLAAITSNVGRLLVGDYKIKARGASQAFCTRRSSPASPALSERSNATSWRSLERRKTITYASGNLDASAGRS